MQKLFLFTFLLLVNTVFAQKTIDAVLQKYNTGKVAYISVADAKKLDKAVFLDAREKEEFKVSHIQKAAFVGFDHFNEKNFKALKIDKKTVIVVYCSVGVRSEKIGLRLQKMGYTNVYNLFGGIFEWKNENGLVYDHNNLETNKIHCYSITWSQYLTSGECAYD
jgi:rhodanese-related sulfurtransferase